MVGVAAVGGMVKHDPKSQTCTHCKCSWTPGTIHKIWMLLFGEYVRTCPQCGTRMTFKLMNHVVKVNTREIKNKGEVWRNG